MAAPRPPPPASLGSSSIWSSTYIVDSLLSLCQRLLFSFGIRAYSSDPLFSLILAMESVSPRPPVFVSSCNRLADSPSSLETGLYCEHRGHLSLGLQTLLCMWIAWGVSLNADSHSVLLGGHWESPRLRWCLCCRSANPALRSKGLSNFWRFLPALDFNDLWVVNSCFIPENTLLSFLCVLSGVLEIHSFI